MTSRFSEIVLDCHDVQRVADFWCAVLDYRVTDSDSTSVEIAAWDTADSTGLRAGPFPPSLLFAQVPEQKSVKDRIHIDVSPVDRSQDDEVERLLSLGATHVDVGQGEQSWVVLADPEGHEFCVLRSLHDG